MIKSKLKIPHGELSKPNWKIKNKIKKFDLQISKVGTI